MGNEKGIRCNTGAVPAAVCPLKVSDSSATIRQLTDGKVQKTGRARRPAVIHYIFFAFGKNSKDELQFIVIHFLYCTESRQINKKLSCMEKVCPRCCKSFCCRNDDIMECWCLYEPIDPELRRFLADNFSGCLCAECITDLRKSFLNYQQLIIIENESY